LRKQAKELLAWGEQHLGELGAGERFALSAVRLLESVEIAALFDFGLTPRHLKNPGDCSSALRSKSIALFGQLATFAHDARMKSLH